MKKVLAFDFGASSGRAMLASFQNGKIDCKEIHRFSNDPVITGKTLYWDVLRLFHEIKQSITKAANQGGFDAIGIDTWGVDFGLIGTDGALIGNPVHYRDTRTVGVPEELYQIISKDDIYAKTGIQFMRFNTLYQLFYLIKHKPEQLKQAQKFLLMPDLLAYFLTGSMRAEYTIASTTNMLNPYTRAWDTELIKKVGIPIEIFPELIEPGNPYGTLSPAICEELGCEPVPVVAVGTHDTASAVLSAPATGKDFVYISCGTWSLFGTENDAPIINEKSIAADFTNEGGYAHKIRFLKNIMGLWLIQESRRQWIREGNDVGYDQLEREALEAKPFRCFIDVDYSAFETPGNLPRRIQEFCEKTGQYVPQTRGEIMRCIYESLAMKYRYTFQHLQEITGKRYPSIHILGGGIKDTLLCKLTASACNVPVTAGPAEATVMGNISAQLIHLGEIAGLSEARQVIRNSIDLKEYEPVQIADWDAFYGNYLKAIGK